ncbi:MAG: single-stranded-DNA-specific exonuclease RecJ [Pyrinomonadaceae bacterium]|nr:single-stranded-DNA-specific exonuclease RecJ [Pyrinomonadaceae bacterium]
MRKRWKFIEHDKDRAGRLAESIGTTPLIAAILISRGYDDDKSASTFLNPVYEDLHDPLLLKGMDSAVERVLKAVDSDEKILIWGDYDVDGTTGTVVLRKALEILGGKTGYHVPHRFREGYGVNQPEIEKARDDGYGLAISVDCGITSFEAVDWATENGMDFIVTDHHLAKDKGVPNAYAVVNPNQPGCEYPDKHLAGVGVAFKLAHALLRERGKENLVPYFLKVVAIGTIADVMKLTGENRSIVSIGLRDLPKTVNPGLKALMEVSECRSEMTSYHIGFRIAPRINAAGRMDAAKHVVELLEADEFSKARELAEYLNKRNLERQKVQAEITERAIAESEAIGDQRFVVISGEGWHRGVIGLAASRIAEKLHRPAVVLSVEDGMAYGSARSVGEFHLLKALDSCADLFEQFGGHAVAAGMTLKASNIDALREGLNEYAEQNLSDEELVPEITIDAPVQASSLSLELIEDMKSLEPFGQGNPKPLFATGRLKLLAEPWIMKEKHLKLQLEGPDRNRLEAVWWDGVEKSEGLDLTVGNSYEVAHKLEANTWQGNTRLQMVISDIRPDGDK